MKYVKFAIMLIFLCGTGAVIVEGQSSYGIPVITTTAVTSTSVPTVIMTPGAMTTFVLKNRAASANSVLVFPYRGTPPTAIPSPAAAWELAAGVPLPDAVTCPASSCLNAMGVGWEAYLATSGSATVDAIYR